MVRDKVGHKFQSPLHPSPIDHPHLRCRAYTLSSSSMGGDIAVVGGVGVAFTFPHQCRTKQLCDISTAWTVGSTEDSLRPRGLLLSLT
jgi:hypothetical protein